MASADPVDIWIADLDAASSESWRELLSDDERASAAKLASELRRSRWIASRAILRAIIGDFAGLDPRALRFELGPHGKPRLAAPPDPPARAGAGAGAHEQSAGAALRPGGPPRDRELCFNLSHSGSLALYALARGREVGVDVELASRERHRSRDELAIARRLLGEQAVQRLRDLPPSLRSDAFLREWTAHEARVKCVGVGIGVADHDGPATKLLSELSVAEIDVGKGAFAAVASEGATVRVRMHTWR